VGADVSLAELGPASYVFLFARAPGGGPPIAGRRLAVGELPGRFTLSDADAIIAGRSLAAFSELTLVARISVSGDPIEQPGDLFAEAIVDPATAVNVGLVIDRVVGQN
jgi:cytochrome c-type biogenesis protein CcmH